MCISLYKSVSARTIRFITSMVSSPAWTLVIRMMGVEKELNGSDCGVLATCTCMCGPDCALWLCVCDSTAF